MTPFKYKIPVDLYQEKVDWKTRRVTKNKWKHLVMTKVSINQESIV